MNRAELKSAAKAQIKGKIGVLFLITLIIGLISGILYLASLMATIYALRITDITVIGCP